MRPHTTLTPQQRLIVSLAILSHCIVVITGSVLRDPRTLELRDVENEQLTTVVDLDGDSCMKQECNLGNLITDSIGYEFQLSHDPESRTSSKGFIVVIPGKRVGRTIAKDSEITDEVLSGSLPYKDQLVVKQVKGKVLKEIFEKSVENYNQQDGSSRFLQIGKGKVVIDFENEKGKRVTSLRVLSNNYQDLVPVVDTETYDVVTTKFLADGNEGFDMLKGIQAEELKTNDFDVTKFYIERRSPVYPAVEERVLILNLEQAPATGAAGTLKFSLMTLAVVVLVQIIRPFV